MKNFTKQNFKTNPLWIRLLIMTFMVLLSTGSAWGAYNQSAVDLYFDNSEAKWSNCYVYIGHSTWTSCYPLTRVSGTQYLWKLAKADFNGGSAWNGATGWVLCYEKWWDANGESIDKYTWHGAKNVTKKRTSAWSASYIYKTSGTVSVTSDGNTINAYNTTTVSNKNYTVTINQATGGTLTVKDYDNNTVSNNASKIYLTVLKFSETPLAGYSLQEVQINDGSTTTTIAAADLASKTHTLTSNVTITPVWESACSPATSITSATLNQDGKISLVGEFTTCGTQYHGFQWRIKGQDWCSENSPNSNSGYVTKNTNVDGEDTDTFTPTLGNTYEFRTYIYGSPWVYSSETVEVATCISPSATHFDYTAPANLTYNDSKKSASVTWKTGTGSGNITIYYKSSTGTYTTTAPTNLGTYTVAVKTAAGGNYCATDDYVVVGTFTINGIAPQASDFTYTAEKNYTGAVLSADVAWKTGTGTGAITTYYKVKGAADGTYTTDKPIDAGTYTIAVTTAAGGNYAAATTKIVLGDFTINEVCDPITNLTWRVSSGAKATYCAGDKVQVTMTYNGNTATAYSRGGNHEGNIDFNVSSMASGVVYTFTIRKSGTINLTLTGCDGKPATTPTLTFNVMADPDTPTVQVVNNIIKCGNDFTQYGKIRITNYNSNYSYKIGVNNDPLDPSAIDANGNISGLTIADQFTLYAINGCGVATPSAPFTITETNNKPTITGATYTQPGKANAIELTLPAGISAKWSVSPAADLSVGEGNSTMFSAEENGTYIITANNGGCTDTHVVTVSDAFYVYMRQPKKGENAYDNFYYPTQNPTQGGDLFYKEYASIPPAEGYTDYNTGGVAHDIIFTDCDGYVWYGFKASDKLIDGTNYFTVRAPNLGGNGGYYTHTYLTKPGAMTSDIYYTMSEEASGNSRGWYITKVSAPYAGPVVHATDASFNKNNFADFAALYVTDCSGKELKSYQWQYSATENGEYADYSSVCTYVGKKTEQGDAGKTNNIRPNVAGWYRCTATYNDDSSATSAALEVTATSGTTKADFNSNLPVIMVNTGSKDFPSCPVSGETASKNAEKMKKKLSVDVKILHDGNIVYDRKARMAYRGSSSLNFQKKSYAFCPGDANCGDADKGEDYVKTAKLNMLGIGNAYDKDWVLYAAAADPSMLRNRMVFETYQAMRPGEWGVKSRYVELIINGEYKGVYVMMDKITQNEKRVNVKWDVKDATKRGFILKFDKTDIADRYVNGSNDDSDEKTFLSKYSGKYDITTYDAQVDQAFEIEYPEKGDIEDDGGNWYEVVDFIKGMINDFETALAAGEYGKVQQYIDYTSWADWFILSEYTKNVDAFRASCVFTFDGNKIKATPLWDQELSFNNQSPHANRYPNDGGNKGCQDATGLLIKHNGVYSDNFAAPFWFTGKLAGGKGTEKLAGKTFTGALLNDPCFVQTVKDRWAKHKTGALSKSSLEALITNYEKELTEAVRTREANFWSNNGYSRNTLSCSWNGNSTGYYDDSYATAKGHITDWISDVAASGSKGRRAGLSSAIDELVGTGLSILFTPDAVTTTPWMPVTLQIQNESGYEYTLEYTDNALNQQPNILIEKSGDTYKYHIPRPESWGIGDAEEGERPEIVYGLKATLLMTDATVVCGSQEEGEEPEAPSATATITLKDEDNDGCE